MYKNESADAKGEMETVICDGHTLLCFNSHEWPKQSFSLQYQYNIKQKSDENISKYQEVIVSWSNTKFSKLTAQELYGRQ